MTGRQLNVLALLGVLSLSLGVTSAAAQGGGSVVGTVRFLEAVPEPERLTVDTNTDVCGLRKFSQDFIVSPETKGLENVVLTVIGLPGTAAAAPNGGNEGNAENEDPIIRQETCEYAPHVLTAVVGQTLQIRNTDDVLHNIHAYDEGQGTLFNLAQPIQNMVNKVSLDKPGVVTVKCDVHRWMLAYVVVAPHRYTAMTDENGTFRIDGIPPGSYQLRAWHEALGQLDKPVTVRAGGETTVTFDVGK